MRLIDADEVIKELNDKIARLDAKQQIYMNNGLTSIADSMARKIELCIECRELLEHQPTAYDVDKVIKELSTEEELAEKEKKECACGSTMQWEEIKGYANGISVAIEIVKGGGMNV